MHTNGRRGDQLIDVKVVVPERLNDKQKKLLLELGAIAGAGVAGERQPQPVRAVHRLGGTRRLDAVSTVRDGESQGMTVDWIEISVAADGEAAEAVSELFNRLNSRPDGQGGAVTEVGGWDPIGEDHHPFVIVKTYLADGEPSTAATQRQIEEGLWFLGRVYPLGEPQIRPLKEEDWANAWKASYKPLKVGRFLIIPSWERDTVQPAAGRFPGHSGPGHGVRHRACTPARSYA